ncbi:hypothetical protein ACFQ5F_12240 [Kroppenstedtia eburnea]|uniref:hypothetical protein n=1 Tax=Kroppenstedtia eburnea TaxID=714067 RepID=UPI003639DB6B
MDIHEYVPQRILEIVKQNRAHSGDHYSVLPTTIKHESQYYFYVHYEVSDRYLIVRKDGQIPSSKEIEPIIIMAASFVSYSNAFYVIGDQWIKEKTIRNYQRIQRLLDTLEKGLQHRLTEEQRDLLNEFRQTAQTVIDWQRELERLVAEGKKGIEKIRFKVGSTQDRERLDQLQRQLGKCFYEQNQIQLNTYESRHRFIKIIRKSIPISSVRLWFSYYELKMHHQRMLNWSKMDAEEIRAMEIVRKRIDGERDPESNQVLKEIKAAVINPR